MSGHHPPRLDCVAIGMDFDEASLAAARWARNTLAPSAELVLVHAVDPGDAPPLTEERPDPDPRGLADAELEASERIDALMSELGARRARGIVRAGRPPVAVAEVAEEVGADLIAVGPHNQRDTAWALLGTTSERLIRTSPVPVMLVTGRLAVRPRNLLVPVDDGELTPTVLEWAGMLAARWGATVTLAHCVGSSEPGSELVPGHAAYEGARTATLEWLGALATELPPGVEVSTEVLWGRPGPAVLDRSREGCDVIVMGRRGAGRALPGVLGTTSSTVLRGAGCPVLVIVDPPFAVTDI